MATLNIFIVLVFFINLLDSKLYTTYNLTVYLSQHLLPISIASISGLSKLERVRVTMSHLQQKPDGSFASASITAYLYNSSALNKTQMDSISIILQLSRDRRFNFYKFSQKAVIISDPNDKPCTEHIEHYLKYFFPCNNYATLSLEQLINIDQLFGKQLYFEMDWHIQREQLSLIIIFPSQKQLPSEMKRQSNCGSILITQNQQQSISTKIKPFQNLQIDYSSNTINQWYNPQKCLVHLIKNNKSDNNFFISTFLPSSFRLESYQLQPPSPANMNLIRVQGGIFLHFEIAIKQQIQEIAVILHIRSTMPPFEEFETIGGGGEQLMNLAFIKGKESKQLIRLNSKMAILKLLEPDFSLPFKVITFTFAIIGYLWVNLWRIHKTSLGE